MMTLDQTGVQIDARERLAEVIKRDKEGDI